MEDLAAQWILLDGGAIRTSSTIIVNLKYQTEIIERKGWKDRK